ncbi:LuxR C-terminal-related transcriptional regulator [Thermodesulfobacteriota bacterium]
MGYTPEEMGDVNFLNYVEPGYRDLCIKRYTDRMEGKDVPSIYEIELLKKDGKTIRVELNAIRIDYKGEPADLIFLRDTTDRKKVEQELMSKSANLEEVNTALEVLLDKRGEDKLELENNVLTNVNELILPYIEKIKGTDLDERQEALFSIIEANLNEIISPFLRGLSLKYLDLTPKQIQIANLIKIGKSTKQIAELMIISPRTVDTHRKNIRSKIGLEERRASLRSRLISYQ